MRAIALLALLALPAHAATYYVNPEGGQLAQCDGTTNAAYSAPTIRPGLTQTHNPHCSWSHPFIALPPVNSEHHTLPRIHPGDTLVIASGSYEMGFGAQTAETSACYSNAQSDCRMQPLPAGPDPAHRTRILGNCVKRPELWGSGGEYALVDLTSASNTEVGCLELTDHSSCIMHHCAGNSGACRPDQTDICVAGDAYANNGLIASDAKNVLIHDLNIHGLGSEGVRAGRLTDWTVRNVRLWANGFAGWDGDIRNGIPGADTSNHGALWFDHVVVGWSGCGERYPGGAIFGCWDQDEGGYGDGLGTGPTSGNWTFVNSTFQNNVSDGLDLLYADGSGSIVIRGFAAQGNAGNQLKVSGPTSVTDALLVGTCAQPWSTFPPNNYAGAYTPAQFVGKYNMQLSGNCRASGDVIAAHSTGGSTTKLIGSTVTGQASCLMMVTGSDAAGSNVLIANSILTAPGQVDWQQFATGGGARPICGFYDYQPENPASTNLTVDHSIFFGLKNDQCPPGAMCVDPMLASASPVKFNPALQAGSPAKNAGNPRYCGSATAKRCNIGYAQ